MKIAGLTKRYRDTVALNGVSLEIEAGKITAVLGGSGASYVESIEVVYGDAPAPVVDTAKVNAFHTAVQTIAADGSLSERRASINAAITAYTALSEDDRGAAAADVTALNEAIKAYNDTVKAYNQAASGAETNALNGAGFFKRGE